MYVRHSGKNIIHSQEKHDMINSDMPHRTESVETVDTEDGVVVQREDRIHTLNTTAREVYELCDGTRTVAGIIDVMVERYGSDAEYGPAGVEKYIRECIEMLSTTGLITAT